MPNQQLKIKNYENNPTKMITDMLFYMINTFNRINNRLEKNTNCYLYPQVHVCQKYFYSKQQFYIQNQKRSINSQGHHGTPMEKGKNYG